jgi:hypothetical protein
MTHRKIRSRLALIVTSFIVAAAGGPIAAAEGFTRASYFENSWSLSFIGPNYEGSNSVNGSVMPNRHSGAFDRGSDADMFDYTRNRQGGALGYWSLGISPSTNNTDRKQALFDYLKRNNDSGTPWERMGSAFIVHQMTGQSWGVGGRDIPDSQWNELYARLVQNDDVQMVRGTYDWRINTSGVLVNGSITDATSYAYDFSSQVDAWILSVDGSPQYVLEVICANPLGALDGLPPAQYSLTPSASVNKTMIEPDETVSVTNTVRNGSDVRTNETDWRLTKIEYRPNTNLSSSDMSGRTNDNDPCAAFTSGGRVSCQQVQQSPREIFNPNSTKTYNPEYDYDAPVGMAVGTKICFTASVSRPTRDPSPSWRHSSLQCVIVGKKPKMQVWGGDVRVGDGINTSTSTFSSLRTTYGSWGEYGALSNRGNSGFASGAGLNDGSGDSAQGRWSDLTFANSGNASCPFGCYGFSSYAPALTGQFTRLPSSRPLPTGTPNLSDLASGSYWATSRTIAGGSISPGKTIVIVATDRITIAGDITYSDGPYTNVADIPQVVIRAAEINITGSVGNVDAWLLATTDAGDGIINTCSDLPVNEELTVGDCNRALRINGPVVTDKLYLRRTAGATGGRSTLDDPAELFNLRADAFIWGNGYGGGNGKIQTVHTKELPPRF